MLYLHGLQRIRSSQVSQSILLGLRDAGRPAALGLDMQAVQLDPDVALGFGPHLWLRARVQAQIKVCVFGTVFKDQPVGCLRKCSSIRLGFLLLGVKVAWSMKRPRSQRTRTRRGTPK